MPTSLEETRRPSMRSGSQRSDRPLRVLLADEHLLIRRGLALFLSVYEDRLLVVGEAQDGVEAVHLCQQLAPDVVLLQIFLPRLDGVQCTRAIRARCPHTQIVILSVCLDAVMIEAALEAGALGYLSKMVEGQDVVAAIRAAALGDAYLSADVSQVLGQRMSPLVVLPARVGEGDGALYGRDGPGFGLLHGQ